MSAGEHTLSEYPLGKPLDAKLQELPVGTSSVGCLNCSRYVRSAVGTAVDAEGTYVRTSISS